MFFESFLLNLTVIVVLIVALIFDYVTKFFSYWYVRHIPYKLSVPFFGSDYHRVLALRSNTDEVNKLYKTHSKDKFVGRIKSRIPDVIVKDPDTIKRMLSTDFSNFHSRGLGLDKSQDDCLRNNLFYANGEKWTLLREGMESLLNSIDCRFENGLHGCLSGTNGDASVQNLLSKVLDKIYEDLLIGNDDSILKDIRRAAQKRGFIEKIKSYFMNIFPSLYVMFGLTTLPGLTLKNMANIQQSKLMKQIKNLGNVHQLDIKDKRKNNSDTDFALSVLAMFVTEGYIPCLNVLTALLFELAYNSEAQKKSRESVSKQNGDDYLDLAIKEILRMYPPYSVITRECVKTYQSPDSNLLIDKRVTVNVPVEAIHRDEEHYKNAQVFNPDRFTDDASASKHCYAYLPYGAGPRKCIGEQLSQKIIRGVTKAILNAYEIEPCSKTPITLPVADHNFGRVIDRDIWLKFKPISV